jgi:hypothetical protein
MRHMRRWIIVLAGLGALVAASAVLAAGAAKQFVGAARCGECHQAALQAWKGSAHARAHDALPQKHAADPRCTQCHGTGEDGARGVQCESCHGAGRHYAERYVMKDHDLTRIVGLEEVTEKTCRRCHTDSSPSIRGYEHESMWQAIVHGLDREERGEAEPAP